MKTGINMNAIKGFAKEYLELYQNPDSTDDDLFEGFGDRCFDLGFKMDCGKSFAEKYSIIDLGDYRELEKVIDDIDDPVFLGTTIFSYWRFITHWSYCDHLTREENRKWFCIAFERLYSIT